MRSIIIGTAGHIDHGKSALVRALTGKDPDRLPEEKRRGITIDLGFADLDLNGLHLGFVDVPGHERFVKNMLAGAHGIDLVALVIAADEGVMPQTREHFDICRLLGVQGGLIVITKTDLVEEELIPLVVGEVQELVAGSFLEAAPVVRVSTKTQTGLDHLRQTLRELAAAVPARSSQIVSMLPVDRSFTMKGFGPVVTGTLISGQIIEGMEMELLPGALKVRARGLQVHGRPVQKAIAGQRTAVNLGGVDSAAIQRGMVLAPAGRLRPVQILDVSLEMLPSALRPLRSRSRIRFHAHTIEVLGRIRVLNDTNEIQSGKSGFAQLRLESPVVAHFGQRFIIRLYSPSITVAGGLILNPFATKHRGKELANVQQTLTVLKEGEAVEKLSVFITEAREKGLKLNDVAARTGWDDNFLGQTALLAKQSGTILDCEGVHVSRAVFEQLAEKVLEAVNSHHKKEPLERGIARETLRERIFAHTPAEVFRAVLSELESKLLIVAEKELVRARAHTLELSDADAGVRDRLEEIFEHAALEPPTLEHALKTALQGNSDIGRGKKILQMLLGTQVLVRVQGDLVFHRRVLDELIARLRSYASQHEPNPSIDVTAFKELAGVSRKYAIPLLEFLDRERITRRTGDRREILKSATTYR